jgi:RHS repeat-associated protein
VTRRTDPDSNHEDFTYNSAGQVLTDTDRNGHTTSFAYDSLGRVITITYPGTGTPTVHIGYDSAGDVTHVTDEVGDTTTYTYDNAGRVLTSQDPVQAAASKDTAYAYDAAGNQTSMTDALGHVTSYTYDARNRLTAVIDPVNQGTTHQISYGYDSAGNRTSATDQLGHTTSYGYDGDNRPTTVTDPLNHTTTYTYDSAGELTAVNDPNGNTTSYSYDNLGELQSKTLPGTAPGSSGSPVPVTTTYTYDPDGNVTGIADAMGHSWSKSYDNLNRLTSETSHPSMFSQITTSYGYDTVGNRTSLTDGLGHITSYTYDSRNRLSTEVQPSGGGTTTYTYDNHSRLLTLTDPDNNTTTYGYSAADHVTTETDPRGKITTYAYDVAGNLTQKTDRDNRVTQYGYDADNRPTTETWVSSSPANTVTMTYDIAGRETAVQDANSHYTLGYDNANRLTSVDNSGTTGDPHVILTYTYDNAGNRTSLDDSLGGLTSYTYDVRNELTTLTQSGSGVTAKRADFAYDAAGRTTSLIRYANLAGTSTVLATAYGYDNADRLTTITHETALSGGTVRASYGYTLDTANRLTSESRTWASGASSDTVSYSYTNNDQLTGVTHTNGSFSSESFGYDANGNRNTTGYSTGTGNRLSSDGTYNYGYDDEGNLTSKTNISTGNQTLYKWDFRNRLTEVDSVISGVNTMLATYTYDALDRRIGVSEGGSATWTVFDGVSPILDFNGSGTQVARYLDGPTAAGVDGVLARETSGGTVAWYLQDRLGTVRDIVDNTGALIDHIDYGVFGNVVSESSTANGDRFKFAGMQYDAVIGLYFDNARWYGPELGSFVSQDPLGFDGGDENLDRYVGNAPINGIDPSGSQAPQKSKPRPMSPVEIYLRAKAAAGETYTSSSPGAVMKWKVPRIPYPNPGMGEFTGSFGPLPAPTEPELTNVCVPPIELPSGERPIQGPPSPFPVVDLGPFKWSPIHNPSESQDPNLKLLDDILYPTRPGRRRRR